MAPSSRSISYDALLSLSLEYIRPGLYDQIFTSAPFLAALYGAFGKKRASGKGIRLVNGGERVKVPLMYEGNSTVGAYSGYDTLDVTPQDGITTAFYTWRQMAVSIAISRKEERQNAGEGKIKDLLGAKVKQAEMTFRDRLNRDLIGYTHSSGLFVAPAGIANQTANAGLHSIAELLPTNRTTTTVGNINSATYAWWRHNTVDASAAEASKSDSASRGFAATTWTPLKAAMRWLYNSCGRGAGGFPDLGLMDQLTFESIEAAMDDKVRYTGDGGQTKGPVSIGFDSIKFKNQNLVWDEMVPDMDTPADYLSDSGTWTTGSYWMINTDFMELVIDSGTNLITTPFMRPENQDAKVAQILFMGNLTDSNRRKHGLMFGIQAGITS